MQCVQTLRGHSKPVTQLRLAQGRLYTAAGGAIRVWDTATLRLVDRIQTSLYSGGIRSMLVRGRPPSHFPRLLARWAPQTQATGRGRSRLLRVARPKCGAVPAFLAAALGHTTPCQRGPQSATLLWQLPR